MAINTERIGQLLQHFVLTTAGVEGVAVVTSDGLPLAAHLPGTMDEERVSAMAAAMLSLGERIGAELARGDADRIYVDGDYGQCILTSCGHEAVFLVLANKLVKQGVLLLEIKRILAELKPVLDQSSSVDQSSNTVFAGSFSKIG